MGTHKIELRSKDPNKVSTGANTQLYIDGNLAKGVKSFKYEIDARGVGSVTIEYYANVEIDCNIPDIVAEGILIDNGGIQELGNLEQTTYIKGEDDNEC